MHKETSRQTVLFVVGLLALAVLLCSSDALAQDDSQRDHIRHAVCRLYELIETSFGALLATVAGIAAIFAAIVGGYRAAFALLTCSVGAFILRSLVGLFFGEACTGN